MTNRFAQYVGAALLLIGSAAIAWIWVPGGRATSDSPSYLEGARHLAAADGFVTSHVGIGATAPRPIVDFPLGFSLLIVPGIWAGFGAHGTAALVVASSYVVYVLATYLLLLAASRARWPALALLFAAVLMLSPGVLLMLDTIGSDLPGAALSISAACLCFGLIARPTPDLRCSVVIGVLLGCAFLTRWSALYLVVSFALGLYLASPAGWSARQRARCALVVLLVPLAMAAPWVVRNYLTTRTLFGYRRIRLTDPFTVAVDALSGLGAGFFTDSAGSPAVLRIGVTAILAMLTLFALSQGAWRHGPVRLALVSALGYGATLVLSASTSPIDPLHAPRFWLPAWPLLGALVLASASYREVDDRGSRAIRLTLVLVLLIGGSQSARAFFGGVADAASGSGFRKASLATSVAMEFAARHHSVTMFCNDPRVVLTNGTVPLIYELPQSAAQLELLLRRDPIAVLLFTETLSPKIAGQLPTHRQMLRLLESDGRLTLIAADAASEVWASPSAASAER